MTVARRLPRLEGLTGLRWFAAAAVFLHHSVNIAPLPLIQDVTWVGVTGVAFFFVLSGFVLTWSATAGDTPGYFYWRRFARIWPLHLVTTLLAIPVFYSLFANLNFHKPFEAGPVAASVVLLHAWSPDLTVFFAGNPASWSLSVEASFYILFPFMLPGLQRRGRRALLIGAGLLCVTAWAFVGAGVWAGGTGAFVLMTSPVGRLPEFLLGTVLAMAMRAGWRAPVRPLGAVIVLGVTLGVLLAGDLKALMNAASAPAYALLIASVASAELEGRSPLVSRRAFVKLGAWSYAFYLIHATIIYGIVTVMGARLQPSWGNAPALIGVLVASVIAAAILHEFIERPIERRLRAYWSQRELRRPNPGETSAMAVDP